MLIDIIADGEYISKSLQVNTLYRCYLTSDNLCFLSGGMQYKNVLANKTRSSDDKWSDQLTDMRVVLIFSAPHSQQQYKQTCWTIPLR